MPHLVLLGDSVFDNAAYVRGGPDVVRQARDRLGPHGWQATLAAVDGAVTDGVRRQLARVPADATHLVVSAGGNDALGSVDVLYRTARTVGAGLAMLGDVVDPFEARYRAMLHEVLALGLPTAVCTVYNPRFPDPEERRYAALGLAVFNDAILRVALQAGVPVLELRSICGEDEDFANPIEPSSRGGEKMVAAIATMLAEHDFTRGRTAIFG
ncbi:MAG: SGNH/GDSL hydrolase family protein [Gemmatimonadetes bacterium]|nr:SGNH/GDSL hydrolase family protein [Gemmatimonadota bacterium]